MKDGNKMYNYMVNNFNDMVNDKSIRHFNVGYALPHVMDYADEINEKYNNDIQLELIPWIKKEFDSEALFEYTNWMPFRDRYVMTEMFLGYRKLFIYKKYIFQLSLISDCDYKDICDNCKNGISDIHFVASLYGWKDNKDNNKIKPYENFTIEDNSIPDSFWYSGRKYCTGK